MKKYVSKGIIGTIFSCIIEFLGGWDTWLTSLIILMVADIVVGIIKSFLCKSDKSPSGGLSSKSMFRGGIKKFLILFLVVLGNILDSVISPVNNYVRCAVIGYYIANESLSIPENIGLCGIPLPKFLYSVLDSLKNDTDQHHSPNNTDKNV